MPFDLKKFEKLKSEVILNLAVPKKDAHEIKSILWGEAANDKEGWEAKLNTYAKARRPKESLLEAMKRKSAAYYHKGGSSEYKKAKNKELNAFEKNIWEDLSGTVDEFQPVSDWDYEFHENYNLKDYKGKTEKEIDSHLKKQWGDSVDFENKVKMGKEYYFRKKKKPKTPEISKNRISEFLIPTASAEEIPGGAVSFDEVKFESLKRAKANEFDPLRFQALKANPASEFEELEEQEKNTKIAQEQQASMAQKQAEQDASDPEKMNYEQAKEFFKENKPQTIEDEQQVNALLKQKKQQSTGELDYQGQDISLWTYAQTRTFFKDNPPQDMEEEATQNILLKKKKEALTELEDRLMGLKKERVEEGRKKVVKSIKEVGKGFLRGPERLAASVGTGLQWIGEAAREFTPPERRHKLGEAMDKLLIKWGAETDKFWTEQAQTGIEAPDPEVFKDSFTQNPSFTRLAAGVAESIPAMAAAAGITLATGNALAGASTLGLVEGADQYKEAREADVGVKAATGMGLATAVVSTITETTLGPLNRLLKGGTGKMGKDIILGVAGEGTEEAIQGLWKNMVAKIGYEPTRKLSEGLVESFLVGGVTGGIVGGFTSTRARYINKTEALIKDAKERGATNQDIDNMMGGVVELIKAKAETIDNILDKQAVKIKEKFIKKPVEEVKEKPKGLKDVVKEKKTDLDLGTEKILQSPEKYGITKLVAEQIKKLPNETEASHGSKEKQTENQGKTLSDLRNIHPSAPVWEKGKKRNTKIAQELESRGFIDYRGREVSNIDDVVDIAVTFRHPKIEQFQVLYLKEGKVVAHRVISSGAADYVKFKPAFSHKIKTTAKKLNADSVYLAHNHPSGDPTPSGSDAGCTYYLASKLEDLFKGHIVTNGGAYSFIDPTFRTMRTIPYKTPVPKYREGLTKINQPALASEQAKDFIDGKKATIVFLDTGNQVISIDNIDPSKNVGEFIKQNQAKNKSPSYFVLQTTKTSLKNVKFPAGMLDYIVIDMSKEEYSAIPVESFSMKDRPGEVAQYLKTIGNTMEKEESTLAYGVQFKMVDYKGQPVSAGELGKPQPLQAKKTGVDMPKEPETKEKINKTQIVHWIEETFKVPIRGKATHRWKALGMYYGKAELIRLAKWGDLEVAMHETAHHIDEKMKEILGRGWKVKIGVTGKENAKITKELEDLDYKPDGKRKNEGFAEFIRYYLTTGKAQEKAPTFYKAFTETFLPNQPELSKNLSELKKKMDIWQKQGAEQRIIQHIDFKGEHTTVGGYKNKVQKAKDWVLKNWNDEFWLVEKIEKQMGLVPGKNIRPSKDPYSLMTYLKSKAGVIARTMVLEKAVNMKGEIVGKSLRDALAPIEHKDMRPFLAYALSRRVLLFKDRGDLSGKYIESGIDVDDAEYIYNKYYNESWDKVVTDITEWSNHLLDWVIDAGGLTGEEAKMIRRLNPIYLPFKRAFVDEVRVTKDIGGFVDRGAAVKGIKGSGRPIINPIESLISQATEMIAKAHKIRIASSFADLADAKGVGKFIKKVPPPPAAVKIRLSSIKNIKGVLEDLGLGVLDEVTGENVLPEDLDLDKVVTAFTQGWQYKGKDNIVSIVRNGQREWFEIDKDIYKALSGIDHVRLPDVLRVATAFARLQRLGATGLKVSFGLIRNPWRDAFTYAIFSKNPKATIFDPIRGLYREATAKEGDLVWRFKRLGGNLSGMMGYDRAATMATFDEMMVEKVKPFGKVLKVCKHPIDSLRGILSFTEMAPRVEELTSSYNRYIKENPGWSEEDCFIAAFNDAQDVTVNFTKSGYYAKRVNEVSAFFNVAIRGPEKMYRSFKEDPARMFTRGLLYLTLPSLLLWWKNKDKQWYKNLPPSYKYNNFFFEVGENIIVRLPIPFELGVIFTSLPLAGIDILREKDPTYVKGLMELIKMQIPDPTPTMIGPWIDVGANRDFLGRPIESAGMQYLPKPERKRKYTSGMAIEFSKFFNKVGIGLSPLQIDYIVNSYTGGWTKQLPRTVREAADIPIMGDIFLRMPQAPKRQLNSFYSDWEYLSQKKQMGTLTEKERKKYYKNKILYGALKDVYFKNLKKYHDLNATKKVRQINEKIQEKLEKCGYK